MLGDYYFADGDLDKAAVEYIRSITIIPGTFRSRRTTFRFYSEENRLDEAAKLNNEILKTSPNDVDALVYKGEIQIQNKDAGAIDSCSKR